MPMEGICHLFQTGDCREPSHHETPEGRMSLHLCQHCFTTKQNFVYHFCGGGHPNHPASCGKIKLGAIACPFMVKSTYIPSHSPSFNCSSQECSSFFRKLQLELDQHHINMKIEKEWNQRHYPQQNQQRNSRYGVCQHCRVSDHLMWTNLCWDCDVKDFDRAFAAEQRNNDEYKFCHHCGEYSSVFPSTGLCWDCNDADYVRAMEDEQSNISYDSDDEWMNQ